MDVDIVIAAVFLTFIHPSFIFFLKKIATKSSEVAAYPAHGEVGRWGGERGSPAADGVRCQHDAHK